jgi:hypothetical protein
MVAAVTARKAAEHAIPADEPDKERKVNEVVGHTLSELADQATLGDPFRQIWENPKLALATVDYYAARARMRREESAKAARDSEAGGQPPEH